MKNITCKKCQSVLAESNGKFIKTKINGFDATIYVDTFDLGNCENCGRHNIWYQEKKKTQNFAVLGKNLLQNR